MKAEEARKMTVEGILDRIRVEALAGKSSIRVGYLSEDTKEKLKKLDYEIHDPENYNVAILW